MMANSSGGRDEGAAAVSCIVANATPRQGGGGDEGSLFGPRLPHVAHSDLPAIEFKESAKSLYGGKVPKRG